MSSFLKELKWVSLKFSLPMNCLVFCENVSFYFWLKFWQSKEHKIFQEKNKFLFDNSKINKWNKKITIFPQKMFTLKWQNISFIVHFTIGCNYIWIFKKIIYTICPSFQPTKQPTIYIHPLSLEINPGLNLCFSFSCIFFMHIFIP